MAARLRGVESCETETLSVAGPVKDRGEREQEMLLYITDRMELKFVLVYSVVIIFTFQGNFTYSRVFD